MPMKQSPYRQMGYQLVLLTSARREPLRTVENGLIEAAHRSKLWQDLGQIGRHQISQPQRGLP
jgi:hypothetical protein